MSRKVAVVSVPTTWLTTYQEMGGTTSSKVQIWSSEVTHLFKTINKPTIQVDKTIAAKYLSKDTVVSLRKVRLSLRTHIDKSKVLTSNENMWLEYRRQDDWFIFMSKVTKRITSFWKRSYFHYLKTYEKQILWNAIENIPYNMLLINKQAHKRWRVTGKR